MGVKGFWKLMKGKGLPVPHEQLQGATVFVDYTVWVRKALMDEDVAAEFCDPSPNVHELLQALLSSWIVTWKWKCKELVLVIDGARPPLKREERETRDAESVERLKDLHSEFEGDKESQLSTEEIIKKQKGCTYLTHTVWEAAVKVASEMKVKIWGSPYEADWTLAWAYRHGMCDYKCWTLIYFSYSLSHDDKYNLKLSRLEKFKLVFCRSKILRRQEENS